ncbi:MAG: ABC transporter ATP-binding protein [Candidatus Kariarchaeaceae archaeon]|jgi:multiple sugar transport system ATP-binding protein
MTVITLNNLTKIFGEEKAVDSFELTIKNGEFLVLVGPSGCGKSTTLRMIAGLEQATAGTILFDDENITDYPPKARNVGMVFQSYALYPHMSIDENLSFGLRLQGADRVDIAQRVDDVAELLGIKEHLGKKPKQLSGGQRQRVALGRAIIRNPNCFLFDEPLSNLDAKLRVQMRAEIQRLQRRTNITSIYVTHDQTEAMSMADRIAIMDKGLVQQVGSPSDVYLNPVNKFVATFIGSPEMNLLKGELSQDNGQWVVKTVIGSTPVSSKRFDLNTYGNDKIWIGIRPEHLLPVDDLKQANFKVVVDVVEPLGADTFLYSKLGEKQFTIRLEGILDFNYDKIMDKDYGLTVEPDKIHLFDYKTELSLRRM